MFATENDVRVSPIVRQTQWPFKVDSPTFGGQIRDDQFGKESANTCTTKGPRLAKNIAAVREGLQENTRQSILRRLQRANFALGLGPTPVQDPTDP